MPDRFGESVENRSHPRRIAVAQHPRRLLVDIAVGVADDAPDRFECQVKILLRDVLSDDFEKTAPGLPERRIGGQKPRRLRHLRVAIAADADSNALREMAESLDLITVQPDNL